MMKSYEIVKVIYWQEFKVTQLSNVILLNVLDPEACDNGFTIQMTLKVYRDSVFNTSRLFIVDSGAWSKDSRGLSIYVNDGRIGGMVVTRDEIYCIHKILEPYIDKWC